MRDQMSMKKSHPILLPLSSVDASVVLDALVAFAGDQERDGDPCGVAPIADDVAERVRRLEVLDVSGFEAMKAMGVGICRGRPQG